MGVLAGQEDRRAAGDVIFQRDEQVFQVVERKLVVALVQARPQAPQARRNLLLGFRVRFQKIESSLGSCIQYFSSEIPCLEEQDSRTGSEKMHLGREKCEVGQDFQDLLDEVQALWV